MSSTDPLNNSWFGIAEENTIRLTLDAASNKFEKIKSSKKQKEKEREEAEEEYERALSR